MILLFLKLHIVSRYRISTSTYETKKLLCHLYHIIESKYLNNILLTSSQLLQMYYLIRRLFNLADTSIQMRP